MVEFVYVIQRDDGMFYCGWKFDKYCVAKEYFTKSIEKAILSKCVFCKTNAHREIKQMDLKNCKPVKIKIDVVEE